MAIIEVTNLKQLFELLNDEESPMREEIIGEEVVRKYIRKKITKMIKESKKQEAIQELRLREAIRKLLKEGDISDMHPHRSTGINILEDVLKKMITTLRTDYKRMTTSKMQRESFRAHMISAVKKALAPSLVNDTYLSGTNALLSEPPSPFASSSEEAYGEDQTMPEEEPLQATEEEGEEGFEDLDSALTALEEAEIDIDIEGEEEKKIPVEDDDQPDELEQFGDELSDLGETGRNMAFTTFKKVSQYILDAYDMLANMEDKKIFVDYLITNMKLYFDKFEDELQKEVSEPSTEQYDSMQK